MSRPPSPADVLTYAKEAITAGRFLAAMHFDDRMAERNVDMADIHAAIDRSHQAVRYPSGKPQHGGTAWRIIGPDCDGEGMITLGIEVYKELNGLWWIKLCTVM